MGVKGLVMPANNPLIPMELSGRDRAVVALVARFKQASSTHIYELLFSDVSRSPCDVALRRLVTRGYLARVERRIVGGTKGGSGQYVYQLGRRGWFMHFGSNYKPWRSVNFHALGIVEAFIQLKRAEAAGRFVFDGYSTEPDSWAVIGGVELRPDLFIQATTPSLEQHKLWLEVDMATEGQKQLRGKLEAYWRAYSEADVNDWPVFPKVVWIAVDVERAKELRWLIQQMPEQAQPLFAVTTLEAVDNLFN